MADRRNKKSKVQEAHEAIDSAAESARGAWCGDKDLTLRLIKQAHTALDAAVEEAASRADTNAAKCVRYREQIEELESRAEAAERRCDRLDDVVDDLRRERDAMQKQRDDAVMQGKIAVETQTRILDVVIKERDEARGKWGHVEFCHCHADPMNCENHNHPYRDPRCSPEAK